MNLQKEAIKTAAIWGALVVFMLFTRPANMPVYVLFAPFIVLGFGVYALWRLLIVIYTRAGSRGQTALSRKQRAAGIALSLLSVVIIGLQSIGEMAPRDIVTVTLLAIGAYFYFVRNLIRD